MFLSIRPRAKIIPLNWRQYAAEFYCAKKEERVPRVESVIERLGLESARNTKCGGTFYRGLSGGQLRRVSIGIELVAQPDILALDEPTSGYVTAPDKAHSAAPQLRCFAARMIS
jgi:ABC-type glutathione transport system ATPase component